MFTACTVSIAAAPSKPITRRATARTSASTLPPPAAAPATIGLMFAPSAETPSPPVANTAPPAIAQQHARKQPLKDEGDLITMTNNDSPKTPPPTTGKPPKPNEINLTELIDEYIDANKGGKNG